MVQSGLWGLTAQGLSTSSAPSCCVSLGKSLHLSGPRSLHCKRGLTTGPTSQSIISVKRKRRV